MFDLKVDAPNQVAGVLVGAADHYVDTWGAGADPYPQANPDRAWIEIARVLRDAAEKCRLICAARGIM